MGRNLKQHIKFKGLSQKRVYQACALLLFLAVGSSMLATSPMAKYVTQANSGEESARVAKFSVSAASSDASASRDYTLNSTTTAATYDFTVTSDSEVATTYDVKVTVPSELVGVTPTLTKNSEDATSARSATWDATAKTYTFTAVGTMTAGTSNTDTLHLTFTKADGATAATYENIKVEAVVTQVD